MLNWNWTHFILSIQKSKPKREDSIEDHQQKTTRSKVWKKPRDCSKQRGEKKITFLLHEAASGTPLVLATWYDLIFVYIQNKNMYVHTHIGTLVSVLLFQKLCLSVSQLKSTAVVIWLQEKLTWMTGFRHNSSNSWLNKKKMCSGKPKLADENISGINFELLHTTMNTRKVVIIIFIK